MVSICIPTYNNPEGLKRCLDSIAMQTLRNFEIIVSDDSTGDEIRDLVAAYDNLEIDYVKNESPLGAPANWNQAIGRAKGKYVHLLHHDDYYAWPNSLSTFYSICLNNPDADLVFCDSILVDDEQKNNRSTTTQITRYELRRLRSNPDNLALWNTIGAPSACVFKRNPERVFDEKLEWLVDVDFYIRLLRDNPRVVYITERLVAIGLGSSRISKKYLSSKKLRRREARYLRWKLRLWYSPDYLFYHLFQHKISPKIKRIFDKKMRK